VSGPLPSPSAEPPRRGPTPVALDALLRRAEALVARLGDGTARTPQATVLLLEELAGLADRLYEEALRGLRPDLPWWRWWLLRRRVSGAARRS